jgi:hypothetical protein
MSLERCFIVRLSVSSNALSKLSDLLLLKAL